MAAVYRSTRATQRPRVQGNLALDTSYVETLPAPPVPRQRQRERVQPAPRPREAARPAVRRLSLSSVVAMLTVITLLFGLCFGLVSRYLEIARNDLNLQSLNEEIHQQGLRAKDLRLELAEAENVQYVELVARERLNMVHPMPEQIRSIALAAPVTVETPAAAGEPWWQSLWTMLRSYLD